MLAALDHVTLRFGDLVALDDVSLQVGPGERVGLLGVSGAGKSSLLALLGGRILPTTGTVTVLGADTERLDRRPRRAGRAVRDRIGTVHQDLAITDQLDVRANVIAGLLGRRSTLSAVRALVAPGPRSGGRTGEAAVEQALDVVGLADRARDRVGDLSGGQRQRVAVARLLVQDPDLVLADEPAASLDPELGALVLALLADVVATEPGRRGLVVSLHDPDLARASCSRLVGLRDGHIVFDAPPDDVDDGRLDTLYAR